MDFILISQMLLLRKDSVTLLANWYIMQRKHQGKNFNTYGITRKTWATFVLPILEPSNIYYVSIINKFSSIKANRYTGVEQLAVVPQIVSSRAGI